MNKISVAIISRNEEGRIEAALKSAGWADEIVVVDAESTDKTTHICAKYNCKIFTRKFDNFSGQKNFAISKCSYPWIFFLDSDEVISSELANQITGSANSDHGFAAYEIKRINRLFGKVLRHQTNDDFPIRLFKNGSANFIQPVHEYLKVDGKIGRLEGTLFHNSTPSVKAQIEKTDFYTDLEAKWILDKGIKPGFFEQYLVPLAQFFRLYLLRLGFLDGKEAFLYAYFSGRYSFIKYKKARALLKNQKYLESIITRQFDRLHRQFPDTIDPNDSRLNYLLDNLGNCQNKSILELGCGKGRFLNAVTAKGANCVGIDVSEKLLNAANNTSKSRFLKSSATCLPFKPRVFDLVFAVEVIEHVPNLKSLIAEAKRVLKDNGKFIIIDRNILSLNNRRYLAPNFIIKKYHELKNDWMYPKSFAYTEKWFTGPDVNRLLKKFFKTSSFRYIISDSEKKSKFSFIFKALPMSRHFILWQVNLSAGKNKLFDSASTRKEFEWEGLTFWEELAKYPKVIEAAKIFNTGKLAALKNGFFPQGKKGIFSLRIDADEIEKEDDFLDYLEILQKYSGFITIFFCAHSFQGKGHLIKRAKEAGFDIQSHGYYHYTYNDFANNFHNLNKAKKFFEELGINTCGFASPMGKYNRNLILALEKLGYTYSSDFSFDYLNFPLYPKIGGRFSKILEIPIFPVCPELLFQSGLTTEQTLNFFEEAIAAIKAVNLPLIFYAHTDKRFPQTKKMLVNLLEKIHSDDNLYRTNLTAFNRWCRSIEDKESVEKMGLLGGAYYQDFSSAPLLKFLGKEIKQNAGEKIKQTIKYWLDYEIITPKEELKGNILKKYCKLSVRNLLSLKAKERSI